VGCDGLRTNPRPRAHIPPVLLAAELGADDTAAQLLSAVAIEMFTRRR
jgi:hypothetical protein